MFLIAGSLILTPFSCSQRNLTIWPPRFLSLIVRTSRRTSLSSLLTLIRSPYVVQVCTYHAGLCQLTTCALFCFGFFSLQKATGVSFEVDIDWLEFIEPIETRGYKDRLGDIIYDWYVSLPFPKVACSKVAPRPCGLSPLLQPFKPPANFGFPFFKAFDTHPSR